MNDKVLSDNEIYDYVKSNLPSELLGPYRDKDRHVLISAPYMMANIDVFRKIFEELGIVVHVADVQERLEEEHLMKYTGIYDVALIGDDRYTTKILNQEKNAGRLLGLSKWGTGIDSINLETAASLGIVVKNTHDAFSEPVAESILGAVLAFNRSLFQSTNLLKEDKNSWIKIPGKTLIETRFGIVGLGNVGRSFLRKLLALGVGLKTNQIASYDILGKIPLESHNIYNGQNVDQKTSLDELIAFSPDFLIISCCQTSTNTKLIGSQELSRLPNNCVVINMARGRLIDEEALIVALTPKHQGGKEHIRGAALDVFWDEPLPAESMFRRLPNVILTSHNSNSSPLYWLKVHANTIKNALLILNSK